MALTPTQQFGATSTTEDVLSGVSLTGKRVLVTGVSAGLGVETARALAAHGATVVGTARNIAKAERATAQVRAAAQNGGGTFELLALDLADLSSVRAAADHLNTQASPFDLIIANAGVMATPMGHTKDGFETQFGTNHLGHFVLINRIAGLLHAGARVVNVSSAGHRFADVDLSDPNFEHTPYDPWVAYGRSKTANILFAVAFDARHKARGVRATAIHPGGIMTELTRHLPDGALEAMVKQVNAQAAEAGKPPFVFKTIPQGAATSIWAGVVAPADAVGGHYCEDCHVAPVVPDATPGELNDGGVRAYAVNPAHAKALWKKSEEMVGETFV
ncbi:SDR family NAD(P)-dependent oxidoreductase [Acetobacter lambici]|uniref:SDR family NAD(P)-dependent oxidoreductase n=1 Tax=Acetobacter lambici TaxID=1332824 RepID=A0ABT1EZQ8_9PROT|nr:SDR family NAD(P)-dependent oxidoreductase [Acetobacter lambici]MCP1242311.1 SDR family NAD(P)-dependent oxidoreductase [Acetobacter lambici]MCP1258427.1 SDR family NAD(P)-dependent oxidoreductase [Acetobacter lambici]NHO56794.1 SDR family NAD(P)-dependent oxidoreductase [Acetobacter lambici]